MATVNNVVNANVVPNSATNIFNLFWSLTRTMKKAGWKYQASGDGSSKDTSADPSADLWGGGVSTGSTGAAASITTVSLGRATVTGLSGIVASDKGRFLEVTGSGSGNDGLHQIEEVLSATSVRIDARTATITGSDANNGSLGWDVLDPLLETYPSGLNSVSAWWNGRGPSTVRIPITSAPSAGPLGLFVRGENVVQSGTGAEGEILGWVFDSGAGYLVIAPRLRGTGGDPYGWATGNTVTGDVSGATVGQVGTALEYRNEIVIWKAGNQNGGTMYMQVYEPVAEAAANAFSTLAGSAGCTSTVAPGGGGTGNGFPTVGWVVQGEGGTATHRNWNGYNFANDAGSAQVVAVDAIEEQDYTADGSWALVIASTSNVNDMYGHLFQRMENHEPGDVHPYVAMHGTQITLYGGARTGPTQQCTGGPTGRFSVDDLDSSTSTSFTLWTGWRRRGLGTGDAFQQFEAGFDHVGQSNGYVQQESTADAESVATSPVTRKVRRPVSIVSVENGSRMAKGTLKWVYAVMGANRLDTYDSQQWIQLSSRNGALILGPWDGATTPTA